MLAMNACITGGAVVNGCNHQQTTGCTRFDERCRSVSWGSIADLQASPESPIRVNACISMTSQPWFNAECIINSKKSARKKALHKKRQNCVSTLGSKPSKGTLEWRHKMKSCSLLNMPMLVGQRHETISHFTAGVSGTKTKQR